MMHQDLISEKQWALARVKATDFHRLRTRR